MGKKFKGRGVSYYKTRDADTLDITIKDPTHRVLERMKGSIKDKNFIRKVLGRLEEYGTLSVYDILKGGNDWF